MTTKNQTRTYDRNDCIVFRKTKEKFGGLSNMASGFPLEVNGIKIRSSEALYQVCRFPYHPEIQKLIIQQRSPMTAKMKGKPHREKTRPDWLTARINIMRWCLRVKLAQNWDKFSSLLLETGDKPIVEDSRKDDFWGAKMVDKDKSSLVGMNVLGRLLMELREELKQPDHEKLKVVHPLNIKDFLLYKEPIGTIVAKGAEHLWDDREEILSPDYDKVSPYAVGSEAEKAALNKAPPAEMNRKTDMKDVVIPKECKRLIEVDFPLSAVNDACVRENNRKSRVDSGHISLIHSWWARRPLSSCRAVLLATILPDPTDSHCPKEFNMAARNTLQQFKNVGPKDVDLQRALFDFIAELSNWDLVDKGDYASIARELVKACQTEVPHVFDPFSGGGSIPLEGLRLGCEITASELNPVAWFLLKIVLEWCGRKGPELAELFDEWSEWVLKETENRLSEYYPADDKGRKPLAYLWARTVQCEATGCGVKIPLVRNLWLSQSKSRKKALRISYPRGSLEPRVEVFTPSNEDEVEAGTVKGNKAACPKCHKVTPRERVQAQLREKRGGADDALLLAVARQNTGRRGKDYYAPTQEDLEAASKAHSKAKAINLEMPSFPQNDTRAFPPGPYGILTWTDVLAPRQRFSRWVIHDVIEDALKKAEKEINDQDLVNALAACLYAAYSDNAQYQTSLCVWLSEGVKSLYIQGSGVPMRADFVEGSPLSPNCEGLGYSMRSVCNALRHLALIQYGPSSPLLANALDAILPDDSVDVVFTDPPYANQIPYAHLADFFYGWLRLGLKDRLPQAFTAPETEKARELTENRAVKDGGVHDRGWYENHMYEAFTQLKHVIKEDGIASVVFAHKETDRWEALISALVQAGWRTTGSWPIATERSQRMRGQGYAALQTSVHLVCRPRPDDTPIGDWGEVLRELPKRVRVWIERLQGEGIRGADLVFACIGPALEIYSQYERVETAEGEKVELATYLEKVWEVVGRIALEQVLGQAEGKATNSAAGALEEDARLTALFLWTLQATNGGDSGKGAKAEKGEKAATDKEVEENEDETTKKKKAAVHVLTFDVVRRFAQPLGIHLTEWEGRIIKTEKDAVRLIPVKDRAKQLFGQDGARAVAARIEAEPAKAVRQLRLFPEDEDVAPRVKGRGRRKRSDGVLTEDDLQTRREATTLDRVHAAMLLQGGGQTNALRLHIKAEMDRGPDFLRLANALSALYPKESEEKRLLDAMLLAVPR